MKNSIKVLIVDDEPGIRDLLCYELKEQGYQVFSASDGMEAVEWVKKERFHVIISDIKMPKMSGLEMLETVKKIDPQVEVILATGYGTIETAVTAMKKGAYDFIQKPFNLSEIFALVEKAVEKSTLKALVGIYELSKAIFASVNLDVLLPTLIKLSKEILRADEVSIMLLDQNDQLYVAASIGDTYQKYKESRLKMGERVAGRVAQSKEPIVISGTLEKDPRFDGIPSLRDIKSSIVYPLIIDNQSLGVLNANRTHTSDPFSTVDIQTVTIFCSQIAQAVYNAKLYKKLEEKIQHLNLAKQELEKLKNR